MKRKLFLKEESGYIPTNAMYALNISAGMYEDYEIYTIMISPDKSKLEDISGELENALKVSYEETKSIFDKYHIDMVGIFISEEYFMEVYLDSAAVWVEEFKQYEDDLYVLQ